MKFVLDASAVIAVIRDEPGAARVRSVLKDSVISAVNLQEVYKEMIEVGVTPSTAEQIVDALKLNVYDHDSADALAAAALHQYTRRYGRGLGDRSCLSLSLRLAATALTSDREWAKVEVEGLKIELIR